MEIFQEVRIRTAIALRLAGVIPRNRLAFDRADYHWTLEDLNPNILLILNDAGHNLSASDLRLGIDELSSTVNSSKTRVLSLRRAAKTSPMVYLRRVRQAFLPMTLTWQDLRDVDRKLALNIERFYSDYKTSIDSSR